VSGGGRYSTSEASQMMHRFYYLPRLPMDIHSRMFDCTVGSNRQRHKHSVSCIWLAISRRENPRHAIHLLRFSHLTSRQMDPNQSQEAGCLNSKEAMQQAPQDGRDCARPPPSPPCEERRMIRRASANPPSPRFLCDAVIAWLLTLLRGSAVRGRTIT
jgi:hypothetical protein